MKTTLKIVLLILLSVLFALFLPVLYEGFTSGNFEITQKNIVDAVILGIVIPSLILLSRKIKNDYLFVILAFAAILILVIISRTISIQ